MASDIFAEWKKAKFKEDFRFYSNPEFRDAYTRKILVGRARLFRKHTQEDVQTFLDNEPAANQIRILSLGCGPGSDLLGLIGAVNDALGSPDVSHNWHNGQLVCHCIGVDAFDWNRQAFEQQFQRLIISSGILNRSSYSFVEQSMEDFVLNRNIGQFDFISLSFADAARCIHLVGVRLPQLLTVSGRVLVMDIDIEKVRRLESFGFERSFTGTGICMYTRGQGNFQMNYVPTGNSAVRMFKEAKRQGRLSEQHDLSDQRRRIEQQREREQRSEQVQQQRLLEQKIQQEQQKLQEQRRLHELQKQRILHELQKQRRQQELQKLQEQRRQEQQQKQDQQRLLEQSRRAIQRRPERSADSDESVQSRYQQYDQPQLGDTNVDGTNAVQRDQSSHGSTKKCCIFL